MEHPLLDIFGSEKLIWLIGDGMRRGWGEGGVGVMKVMKGMSGILLSVIDTYIIIYISYTVALHSLIILLVTQLHVF